MESFALLLVLTILGLLAAACLPSRVANAKVKTVRTLSTLLIALECSLALLLAIAHTASGGTPISIAVLGDLQHSIPVFSIYYDGAAALMLALVSFVGLIVSRFSVRYLDGEAMQGRYFRWLTFTVGAVSLMVVAGNMLLFFAAWVMTSFGLHQLLLHYRHRAAAHRAAWTKFTISRLGDAFLIGALVLTFQTFGTLDLSQLFEAARGVGDAQATASHIAIGWLLVLGAVTKSAQFPFHTWLPDTMETPTPVSALMHAGIVNAGGYLIIRMSPLVAMAPSALVALAFAGAFTACFAGVVMMTQPAVKRALAYSTIAQMGFMMLQCGLGAFAAAMLHILAHSLYKAHAFLGSGSVVAESQALRGAKSTTLHGRISFAYAIGAAAATVSAYFAISSVLDLNAMAKPGGLVLAFILCLALTTWGWRVFALGEQRTMLYGVAGLVLLCFTYAASYLAVAHVVEPTVASVALSPSVQFVPVGIVVAFFGLFALHAVVNGRLRPSWLDPLRVHAVNGFYVDAFYHRVFSRMD